MAKAYPSDRPEKQREYQKRYRAKHAAKLKEKRKTERALNPDYYRDWHLRNRYGVSLQEYSARLKEQAGRCAICGTEDSVRDSFDVDHDHVTGEVRGLLCLNCNVGLGSFKDSPVFLAEAVKYLSIKERQNVAKFYFRCKVNPTAAPLVLDTFWEAREMRDHPDYERIDEFGEVVVEEEDTAENRIPFAMGQKKRK